MPPQARPPVQLRPGRASDTAAILEMWDGAVAWMVARGQTGQWGSEAASARPGTPEMVVEWAEGSGLTVAELAGTLVGVSVVTGSHPDDVSDVPCQESYLLFVLSSRDHAGSGIGARLVGRAAADARLSGSEVLRVDCWAGAPGLVSWYERQGFERAATVTLGDWQGQVLEMWL